ncbi:type IV secretion system protein VirB10 [Methylibium petroleiphilum]|uniref:type IV secretion system protein VirB10 n=1 Tax=Methylibium petroleiphilum TaxID=105560 RepID=UPI001AD07252|nr:type IV secretion system protein VirB10 [Methylibium petroleiphilum]MBN9202992.1 type IV secretion system protein VirB10 [Methylibium petroleiphilum]
MTQDPRDRDSDLGADPAADGNTISPLPGEPGIPNVAARQRISMSKKGLLAVLLLIGSLVAVAAFTIQRFSASGKKADEESKLVKDKPTAATSEPRRLEMPPAPTASAAVATAPRIPALTPTADDLAEPIGVRRTGSGAPASGGPKVVPPEDAPVLLVTTRPGALPAPGASTRRVDAAAPSSEGTPAPETADPNDPIAATSRNLQGYQRQLQGMLESLTKTAALATGQATGTMPSGALLGGPSMAGTPPAAVAAAGAGLFGGQLQGSATPKVAASMLGNRSLTLPKGTAFTCALKTKVISATSGLVGCQVQRNVFSDDGRVLLIERGSHLDGEYRIASVRPGTVRIPVLWTRIRTPLGVTVDIDSPGTGQLGESGIDGYVDNRWGERIGAAMLLSLIDDSVKLVIQNQASDRQADTIVLPSTTANTSKLAEKVLDSTINIPPLIYQNQGGIVGIYVARDVDFSSVYELKPTAIAPQREGTP